MTAEPEGRSDSPQSWRVRIGAETLAVANEEEVTALATSGKLRPEHYVFDPAAEKWMYARELSFLDAVFATRTEKANPDAWLVQVAGRNFPLRDIDAARAWITNGRLTRASLIRNPVLQKWMRAGEVLELSEAFDSAPPPPRETPIESSRRPLSDALILGGVILLVGLVITGLALYARGNSSKGASSKPAVATTVTTATATVTAPPKMYDYTLGVKADTVIVQTSPATTLATAPAAAATTTSATTEPQPMQTDTAPKPAVSRPKRDIPAVDDAERELLDEEGGDVVFKGTDSVRATPSGDFRVYIDRNGRDARYHVQGCTYVTQDMSFVSLDLARQNYRPCPVCKPPQ